MSESRPMETKLMYYNADDDVPTLIRLSVSPDQVTLGDFKSAINLRSSSGHKFYFKTEVDDIIVKEEITDDDAKLPVFKGNIICYIVPQVNDETNCSDGHSNRHSHNHGHHHHSHHSHHSHHGSSHHYSRSDDFSDDDTSSRISTSTNETSVSRYNPVKYLRRDRIKSNASSVSSVTESSAIDRVIKTVTLDLDSTNYLGMSLIGQSSDRESGGICVGSIMKGGAVAAEGTIQPGDMILQVNEHVLSNMSNDQAVEILREASQRVGRIELVVASCRKFFESNSESYFTIPREEPIQPLNLEAWILTTEAATGLNEFEETPSSESASTSASHSSMPSSYTKSEQRQLIPDAPELCLNYISMFDIAKHAASAGSGLIVKDRKWLKIVIPNAFLGRDLVNWLLAHVKGFDRRRDAYNFAKQLMKNNHIKHTVNKKFSENCYYVFDESVSNESSNENLAGYSQLSFNIN